MERLPDSLAIALWIAGSCWALAIAAHVFGVSQEWITALAVLGMITGIVEWIARRKAK